MSLNGCRSDEVKSNGSAKPLAAIKIEVVKFKIKVLGNHSLAESADCEAITNLLLPEKKLSADAKTSEEIPTLVKINGKKVLFQLRNTNPVLIPEGANQALFSHQPAVVTLIEENPTIGSWKSTHKGLPIIIKMTDNAKANLGAANKEVVILHDPKSFDARDNLFRKIYGILRNIEVDLTKSPVPPAPPAPDAPEVIRLNHDDDSEELVGLHNVSL